MLLLDFSNEVLLSIADQIQQLGDVYALACTCRRWYGILEAYLYRHDARLPLSRALCWAARHGQESTARKALSRGASVQTSPGVASSNAEITPISLALDHGHDGIVRLLLATSEDLDLEHRDGTGNTPLIHAVFRGREEMVRLLLQHGANVNARSSRNTTPLSVATHQGHESIVRLLLTHAQSQAQLENANLDLNRRDFWGQTPLFHAARYNHLAIVRLLLSTDGVDPNARDNVDATPLIAAAAMGHTAVVQALLEQDRIDVNAMNQFHCTALMEAARRGDGDLMDVLIRGGADPNIPNASGELPAQVFERTRDQFAASASSPIPIRRFRGGST
ncbi:hypothetical protein VTN02DRAFT_5498 [Thermoascus thermophilus]